MVSAPGFPHLHAIKIYYTLTDFLLRDNLYPDTAPVPAPNFVTGDKLAAPIKFVPGSRQHLGKICTWTAKTRAIPYLHRDKFMPKVPGHCPDASSGNTTSPYCRAVIRKRLASCTLEKV